jgi:hypothetical protein
MFFFHRPFRHEPVSSGRRALEDQKIQKPP